MSEREKIDVSLISTEAERQFCKRLVNMIIDEFAEYYPSYKDYDEMKRLLETVTIDTVMIHIVAHEGTILKLNNLNVNSYYLIEGLTATINYMKKSILLRKLGLSEQELLDLSIREYEESEEDFKKRFDK